MREFLSKLLKISLLTAGGIVVFSCIFYDFLPIQHSYFSRDKRSQMYLDYIREEGGKYNTILGGMSDIKRNIIPAVLDAQDPKQTMKSFNLGMGGSNTFYLVDYIEYLLTQNSNIERVVIGIPAPQPTHFGEDINAASLWRNITPGLIWFYDSHLSGRNKHFNPTVLLELLLKKYSGFNLMNIVKYRALSEPFKYDAEFRESWVTDAGDVGVWQPAVERRKILLGLEEGKEDVCGEVCQKFFENKKAANTSSPPPEEAEYYASLASVETQYFLDFAQRAKRKGVEVIFLYTPRPKNEAFLAREIKAQLQEADCFVIDLSDPKKYPEFFEFEYSLGKYQNREGALLISEKVGKVITQNKYEYRCSQ